MRFLAYLGVTFIIYIVLRYFIMGSVTPESHSFWFGFSFVMLSRFAHDFIYED